MADADTFDDVGLGPAGTEPAMSPTQDTTDMEVSGLAPEQIVTCDFIDPQVSGFYVCAWLSMSSITLPSCALNGSGCALAACVPPLPPIVALSRAARAQ
jgi:hypothetical protein